MNSITGMNLLPWLAVIRDCFCDCGAGPSVGDPLWRWCWPDGSDLYCNDSQAFEQMEDTMNAAVIELRDLQLTTDIGTYGPGDTRPDVHL